MTASGWFQILLFLALVLLVTKPMGIFMTRVFSRERTFMDPVLRPIERLLYRVTGVDEGHEMRWTEYAISMLLFSLVSMIVLYLMQRLQGYLPFNPYTRIFIVFGTIVARPRPGAALAGGGPYCAVGR